MDMPRYFTLEEANALLVEIRPVVAEIMRTHDVISTRLPEAWPAISRAASNSGSRAASLLVFEFERLQNLIRQVQDQGILVKDLKTGLIDFPSLKDGREVYLCWRYGEDQIDFWHDVDAGFAGRQPL